MPVYLCASLALIVFLGSLDRLRVARAGARALQVLHEAQGVMRDTGLTEIEKERAIRRGSLDLFRSSLSVTARVGLALGMAFLPIAAFQALGITTIPSVLETMLGWEFIGASTLIIATLGMVIQLRRAKRSS